MKCGRCAAGKSLVRRPAEGISRSDDLVSDGRPAARRTRTGNPMGPMGHAVPTRGQGRPPARQSARSAVAARRRKTAGTPAIATRGHRRQAPRTGPPRRTQGPATGAAPRATFWPPTHHQPKRPDRAGTPPGRRRGDRLIRPSSWAYVFASRQRPYRSANSSASRRPATCWRRRMSPMASRSWSEARRLRSCGEYLE